MGRWFVGNSQTWWPEFGPMVEGENQPPQVVLWPPHAQGSMWHTHIYTKRINLIKKKKKKQILWLHSFWFPAIHPCSDRFFLQGHYSNTFRFSVGQDPRRTSQHTLSPGARPTCSVTRVVDTSSSNSRGSESAPPHPPCSVSDRKPSKTLLVCGQVTTYYLSWSCSILSRWVPQEIPFAAQISVSASAETNCVWVFGLFGEGVWFFCFVFAFIDRGNPVAA